jgi:hypothetical protein
MHDDQVLIERSFSFEAVSERASYVASALGIDVFVREIPNNSPHLPYAITKTQWGVFVHDDHSFKAYTFIRRLASSDIDLLLHTLDRTEPDYASEALQASHEVPRAVHEALWQDADQHTSDVQSNPLDPHDRR